MAPDHCQYTANPYLGTIHLHNKSTSRNPPSALANLRLEDPATKHVLFLIQCDLWHNGRAWAGVFQQKTYKAR